ncbi:GNAT family N-acetyltransferase [Gordonia pseudamarae]
MTTTAGPVGAGRAPATGEPIAMLSAGPVRVLLSDAPADIVAAQRLRYRVFSEEPGFSDRIGDHDTGRDADRFDDFAQQLIVRHDDDGVIGCARLLAPVRAAAAGGWYSATEFDLRALDPIAARTVEMGRACVDSAHRSGSVTALMWASVLRYLDLTGLRYVMGSVSVPLRGSLGAPRGAELRSVRDRLVERHLAPWRTEPLVPPRVDGTALDDIAPYPETALPPLLRGYLRLGARVCGEPAVDEVFDVGDFLTVIDRDGATRRYLDRLTSTVTRLAGSGGR